MYSLAYVCNLIKKYVDQKVNQFIICPFGACGVGVKEVLKDYYNLEPLYIVDNEYSKDNPAIINIDVLRDVYQKDMYVILAVEDNAVNTEMLGELSEFVPWDHIINLRKSENKNIKYFGEGFLLRDFLPVKQGIVASHKSGKKIKVRIVHGYHTAWNAISSMCQAFQNDLLFDVLLITGDWASEKVTEQAEKSGFQSIGWNTYQGKEDQPDVLILCLPFKRAIDGLLDCRKYAKLIVVVHWFVVRYGSKEAFIKDLKSGFGIYRPDYYFFDSLLYNEIKNLEYYADRAVEMGNPKFDGIYRAMQRKEYAGDWKKLQGKKVVVWTTTHGIYNSVVTKAVTFDLYANAIFQYAAQNTDMGIIFRPSDELVNEMLRHGFWSQRDLEQLKEYCAYAPNIVFDDTDTYDAAFSIADGIITDAYCGIICSALPTLKPICVTYRSRGDVSWHPELTDNYYSAYETQDVIDFFSMVKSGQDSMLDLRKRASDKYIKYFDGENGLRIKEFIKDKYLETEKKG